MKKVSFFMIGFLAVAGVFFTVEKGYGEGVEKIAKSGIQAAMMDYIYNNTCARSDICTLGSIKTQFDYIHGGVKEKNGYYVSCVDFKSGADVYDVDYYVKKIGGTFVVAKELLHKKNGETVNDILWQKKTPEAPSYKVSPEVGSY